MFQGTRAGGKQCHDFVGKFVGLIRVLDHYIGYDVDKGINNGIRNGTFCVGDVEVQEEGAQGIDTAMV